MMFKKQQDYIVQVAERNPDSGIVVHVAYYVDSNNRYRLFEAWKDESKKILETKNGVVVSIDGGNIITVFATPVDKVPTVEEQQTIKGSLIGA